MNHKCSSSPSKTFKILNCDWSLRFTQVISQALIAQNECTLQTSPEARLAPGSCTVQTAEHMYKAGITTPSIVCATSLKKNAVACSFLLRSKNVRKEGALVFQF